MTAYKGIASGKTYVLGGLIARGGEGAVYEITSHSGKVAKIYTSAVERVRLEKLSALIKLDNAQLQASSAWPQEVIADAAKRPVGFVMPAVTGGKPLHLFITPSDRLQYGAGLSYADLVSIAANLARAVATFHHFGVVLADINFSNFLVLSDGTVRIIDCDSVQLGTKAKFRSCVAMEEFVPPELQGKRMADVTRTADHDNYGLAVLIFLLLVMGRHPCSGNGATPIGTAIAQRMHPFGRAHSNRCPFCVLGIEATEIISPEIRQLFKSAFDAGGLLKRARRPSATDWERALSAFRRSITVCAANPAHAYEPTASSCPWCRIEANDMPALFQPTPASRLPQRPPKKSMLKSLLSLVSEPSR